MAALGAIGPEAKKAGWQAKAPAPQGGGAATKTIEGCVMASGSATRGSRAVQGDCPTVRHVRQRKSSQRSKELSRCNTRAATSGSPVAPNLAVSGLVRAGMGDGSRFPHEVGPGPEDHQGIEHHEAFPQVQVREVEPTLTVLAEVEEGDKADEVDGVDG